VALELSSIKRQLLLGDSEKSHHAKRRVTSADFFDNQLIFGDNLLALKALEQEYTGKVKCVFIDPPTTLGAHLNITTMAITSACFSLACPPLKWL